MPNSHTARPDATELCRQCDSVNEAYIPLNQDGSVAEWLACWTQVQKGRGLNRSRDAVW